MHEFLVYTISGLTTAGIFAITASGLTLTYTTTGIFNFAHGATGMVAAFVYWQMRFDWGWPAPIAFAVCLFVLAPAFGVFLEVAIMRRLENTSEVTKLVVTIALLLSLVALVLIVWDPTTYRFARPLFAGDVFTIGDIRISYNEAIVFTTALLVALGLRLLLYRTRVGVAMRATVDDRALAGLSGSRPALTSMSAWAVGTSLAALAGILVAPNLTLSPLPITLLIVNAYAAAVIGRLRSLPMTFVGALILGLANDYAIGYIPKIDPPLYPYVQSLTAAIPVIVLFIALLVIPEARLRGQRLLRSREVIPLPTWGGSLAFVGCVVAATVMISTVVAPGDLFSMTKMWGLGIIGLSMIPLVGYAGRISLCQFTFAGVGAVLVSHVGAHGSPLGLLYAAVLVGALGALIALPALRLSGIYLALATAAFAVAMDKWLFFIPPFRVFGQDISLFPNQSLNFERFSIFGLDVRDDQAYLIFGSVVFGLLALVVVWIRRNEFGRRLIASKDSPAACATLGMDHRATTLSVFSLSAAMAGIGGGIYAAGLQSAAFNQFDFFSGLSILLVMVVVGINSLGAALGVAIFLGTPGINNAFPDIAQFTAITVGLAGIGLGVNPNGLMQAYIRPLWDGVLRTPAILVSGVLAILGIWILDLAGVIDNWTFAIAELAVLAAMPFVSLVVRRRGGGAAAAPGARTLEHAKIVAAFSSAAPGD